MQGLRHYSLVGAALAAFTVSPMAYGQNGTAIDDGSAVLNNFSGSYSQYQAPASPSDSTPQTYGFGGGSLPNRVIDGFTLNAGAENYNRLQNAPLTVRVRTSDPLLDPGFTPVYENAANALDPTRRLRPQRATSTEEILGSPVVNRGIGNLFGNVNQGAQQTAKNIERVDFIYEVGLRANTVDQTEFGFLVSDFTDSGVQRAGVVAITGIDSNGNPTTFGDTLVTWSANDSGEILNASQLNDVNLYTSNDNDPGNPDDQPVLAIGGISRGVHGRLITLQDLNVGVNETFYGIAMVGRDTAQAIINANDTSLLANLGDSTIFPTGSTLAGSGNLDPTGGTGQIFANSDASNFVQPEPGVNLAVLALVLVLGNRELRRRLLRS